MAVNPVTPVEFLVKDQEVRQRYGEIVHHGIIIENQMVTVDTGQRFKRARFSEEQVTKT